MYTLFDFRMEIYRPNVVKAQSQRVQCERCNGCEHSNERHTCMYRCIHKCIRLFLFHIVFSLFQWMCVCMWLFFTALSALSLWFYAFLIRIPYSEGAYEIEAHTFTILQIHLKRLIIQWYDVNESKKPHDTTLVYVAFCLPMSQSLTSSISFTTEYQTIE